MNDAYQQKQRTKHDQAVKSGNSTAARDAVWRAASAKNLINETETPGLTEDQASALKARLGWEQNHAQS